MATKRQVAKKLREMAAEGWKPEILESLASQLEEKPKKWPRYILKFYWADDDYYHPAFTHRAKGANHQRTVDSVDLGAYAALAQLQTKYRAAMMESSGEIEIVWYTEQGIILHRVFLKVDRW